MSANPMFNGNPQPVCAWLERQAVAGWRASRLRQLAQGVVALILPLTLACASPREETQWKPPPRVSWERIAPGSVDSPANGYRIVAPQPTRGLFPAGIGVTRLAFVGAVQLEDSGAEPMSSDSDVRRDDAMVAPAGTESSRDDRLEGATDAPPAAHSATELHLLADPRNEFLQWNSAFDDQLAVSEVFPIVQRDLGGGEARPEQVLAAVYALGGRLGLIYAVNEIAEDQTEMIGMLYESAGYRPLAAIHASAVTIVPPDADRPFRQEDIWQTDSRALVRERFRRLVHACVHELIVNDLPAEVEAPEGWVPAGPLLPAEWPPPPLRR